jgi:hypothetical protein
MRKPWGSTSLLRNNRKIQANIIILDNRVHIKIIIDRTMMYSRIFVFFAFFYYRSNFIFRWCMSAEPCFTLKTLCIWLDLLRPFSNHIVYFKNHSIVEKFLNYHENNEKVQRIKHNAIIKLESDNHKKAHTTMQTTRTQHSIL